jgi:hypothetical protein
MTRRRFGIFGKPSEQDVSEPAPEEESGEAHEPAAARRDSEQEPEESRDPVTPGVDEFVL